ncbi:MAG: ABC transporter ATP-binding protein [Eggerthella sp.]|uniref:ABC transporter ATP-binding protein n=1 Tax=Eggerthella sp. TaxID=1929886 RepID=UPI0028FE938E|nr:ABC transporter ATP-binding protein [Eggerthella sp.]MDU1387818.1 ABC transporter ATP-binding protein [Eggerthella sp.]
MILLESVSKTYEMGEGVVRALDHVDLQVDQGDFLAIVGPSGSGKSPLMNILGLRDVPDEGRYLLDGMDVGALSDNRLASIRNEKIGFVFQSFNLLGKLTALENVKLPLSYAGVRLKEADARARKQLALVGLEGREHHLPNQLSGGQQQRVAIARALVCEPEIILADEPTGALDSRTGVEIMELFKSLHAEGQTVILITHNQELADEAQRVVRIADGLIQEMERGSHAV